MFSLLHWLLPKGRRARTASAPSASRPLLLEPLDVRVLLAADVMEPPAGLTHWWPADGSAMEVVSGQHGIVRNNGRFGPGRIGSAFRMDGVNHFVELPTISTPSGLTFELWVRTSSDASSSSYPGNSAQTILADSGGGWTSFGIHGGFAQYHAYGQSESWQWHTLTGNTPLHDGQWHHVAVSHAMTGEVVLYVDGREEAIGQAPYSGEYFTLDRIGAGYLDRNLFSGSIDEVSIYDRPLAASEVDAIFQSAYQGKIKPAGMAAGEAADEIPVPADIVSWLSFDGTVSDLVGNGANRLRNGARFAQGFNGPALSLDGLDDFVEIPSRSMPKGLSVEGWVRTTSGASLRNYPGNPAMVITGDANGGWNSFGLQGGLPSYEYYGLTEEWRWNTFIATTPVNDGRWHHVAVTHDLSGTVMVYVDGRIESVGQAKYVPQFTTIDRIGAGFQERSVFDGLIDELSIYDRALAAEEIQVIFHSGSGGKLKPAEAVEPVTDLAHWWTGDANTADSAGTRTASWSGTPAYGPGKVGSAFQLSGEDYLQIPAVTFPAGLTYDAWIKTDRTGPAVVYPGDSAMTILGNSSNAVWNSFGIHEGKLRYSQYGLHQDWGWLSVNGQTWVDDGHWHHVAVTHDLAGKITLYVDGKVDGAGSIGYSTTRAAVDRIGAGYRNENRFDGMLDEVSLYKRALTPQEIQAIYTAGNHGTGGIRLIAARNLPAPSPLTTIVHGFDHGTEAWHVYDYHGGVMGAGNVFYAVSWEGSAGVNQSPYIWADDSRWRIDTPETPHTILALIHYRGWVHGNKVDLREATVSLAARGDELQMFGSQLYFWVLGGSTGISRWHFTAQPIQVSEGTWGPVQTVPIANDADQWTRTFIADPNDQSSSLDDVLRNVSSYGFSFLGFSEEVTGRLSIDELTIRHVGNRQTAPHLKADGDVSTWTATEMPEVIDGTLTLQDPDSFDFGGGLLTVDWPLGNSAEDRLAIRHQGFATGEIGVVGDRVIFAERTIGSFSGGTGGDPLLVRLTGSADMAAVQALLRNVTYAYDPASTDAERSVRFVISDGDGGVSNAIIKRILLPPVA